MSFVTYSLKGPIWRQELSITVVRKATMQTPETPESTASYSACHKSQDHASSTYSNIGILIIVSIIFEAAYQVRYGILHQ